MKRKRDNVHAEGKTKYLLINPMFFLQVHNANNATSVGDGIAKSPKVAAVIANPPPTDVASLRLFLGSVQFYSKFLPSNFSTFAEPFYKLVQSGVAWIWSKQEKYAFTKLKSLLSADTVLARFDASVPIGIACNASNVGIGATLFHRYPDGSERPIANVLKTLSKSQRNYSQMQKEALAIIFALKNFTSFYLAENSSW